MTPVSKAFFVLACLILLLPVCTRESCGAGLDPRHAETVVLPEDRFEAVHGDNPKIPRTDEEVLALAQRIYEEVEPGDAPRHKVGTTRKKEPCGEHDVGLLYAALKNPAISENTRDLVRQMAQGAPYPYKIKTIGHFKFSYRDDHPDSRYNCTLAQVQAAGQVLNSMWNRYSQSFEPPLSANGKTLEVVVTYLPNAYGQTHSEWNRLELDSLDTMKNACLLKTVCAHELYHRVQYSYGYKSGTAGEQWIVEGTAKWSEKWGYPSIKLYMYDMNKGLLSPSKGLFTRSYDACHLWVHLQERATWAAIRDVWAGYHASGARNALDDVAVSRIRLNLQELLREWLNTNYAKDLANAPATLDYLDDEVTADDCGIADGPLKHITRIRKSTATSPVKYTLAGSVQPFGATYYEFTLDPTVKTFKISFTGAQTGDFYCHLRGIKANKSVASYGYAKRSFVFQKSITPGQWDRLAVIVMGMDKGSSYALSWDGDEPVTFPDKVLEDVIRERLIPPPTGAILKSDLLKLNSLIYFQGNHGKVTNLSGIENCRNVTDLQLSNCSISNLAPLSGLTKLTSLILSNNQIADIGPLSKLTNLKILDLTQNQVVSLQPIQGLTKLVTLYVSQNRIASLAPLANLVNLEYLGIQLNNGITNITPLSGMTKLREVYLDFNQITSLAPLSRATNMWHISARDNKITSLAGLSGLHNLQWLNANNNVVSNISGIAGLTALLTLELNNNQVANISALSGLTGLVQLYLGGNQITDIGPLTGLTGLANLSLGSNQITDIQALVANPGLTGSGDMVGLAGNPLNHNCDPGQGDTTDCDDFNALKARDVNVSW